MAPTTAWPLPSAFQLTRKMTTTNYEAKGRRKERSGCRERRLPPPSWGWSQSDLRLRKLQQAELRYPAPLKPRCVAGGVVFQMRVFVNWHELEGTGMQSFSVGPILGESRSTVALICYQHVDCFACNQANNIYRASPAPSRGIS